MLEPDQMEDGVYLMITRTFTVYNCVPMIFAETYGKKAF